MIRDFLSDLVAFAADLLDGAVEIIAKLRAERRKGRKAHEA